jgi:hypothetical protein
MDNKLNEFNLQKEVKRAYKLRTCNVCGCRLYNKNFARHSRTKKHMEADYADNKFEVEKYEPQPQKKNDYMVIS